MSHPKKSMEKQLYRGLAAKEKQARAAKLAADCAAAEQARNAEKSRKKVPSTQDVVRTKERKLADLYATMSNVRKVLEWKNADSTSNNESETASKTGEAAKKRISKISESGSVSSLHIERLDMNKLWGALNMESDDEILKSSLWAALQTNSEAESMMSRQASRGTSNGRSRKKLWQTAAKNLSVGALDASKSSSVASLSSGNAAMPALPKRNTTRSALSPVRQSPARSPSVRPVDQRLQAAKKKRQESGVDQQRAEYKRAGKASFGEVKKGWESNLRK